jgi:NAD-dependent deacetylase
MELDQDRVELAADALRSARRVVAFTGAGISVESGIPPFRGPEGLWSRYDPSCLELGYFIAHPEQAWPVIKEIFFDNFGNAQPNAAHFALAEMEKKHKLGCVITQNIDNLHQAAGSQNVVEYHGNSYRLMCMQCGQQYAYRPELLSSLPPRCEQCAGVLKPDFVFFGEMIPEDALERSWEEALHADVWLVIGSTGEVQPASLLPGEAKRNGATIIEVNVQPSNYTYSVTDIFLQGKATEVMTALLQVLG